jgi:uncharacterized membrane protein
LRHRWADEGSVRRVLPEAALDRLEAAVRASERGHTGEIRLCVEAGLPWSYLWRDARPRERALAMFGKLGVWDTADNNGVLIYLLLADHAIEIVADRGLASRVPADYWQGVASALSGALREGRFEAGLAQALAAVGDQLLRHFPAPADAANPNELPDRPDLR